MIDINQRDLMPVFLGAVASSGEPVLTNQQKVEAAIKELGKGMSVVPVSFRDIVRYAFSNTGRKVGRLFARLNYLPGIAWNYQGRNHLLTMEPWRAEEILLDYAERQEERMFLKRFLEMIRIAEPTKEMNPHLHAKLFCGGCGRPIFSNEVTCPNCRTHHR